MPSVDLSELIPELKEWNNGKGTDVGSWVACEGNFKLAIGYSVLFWPRFAEFEGYVLREGFSLESLRGFEKQCSGQRRHIETAMNHLHLDAIQHLGCEDISRQRLILGRLLQEIYQAKLAWQFPSKHFEVPFDDSFLENLADCQITFYQVP